MEHLQPSPQPPPPPPQPQPKAPSPPPSSPSRDPSSRILWVSHNSPSSYEYGVVSALCDDDDAPLDLPQQELAHETAEILCTLSASPRVHYSAPSTTSEDPMVFLSEAIQYTMHTIPPPEPHGGRLLQYASSTSKPPPPVPALEPDYQIYPGVGDISVSEEEWTALMSAEYVPCGSPVVEEFLQSVLPVNTPAEDRQGWYEFLCEGGGGEECWTKFLGGGEVECGTGNEGCEGGVW